MTHPPLAPKGNSIFRAVQQLRQRAQEDQRGITLIELIIALVLSSLLLTLAFQLFNSSVLTQKSVQGAMTDVSSAQVASSQISRAVRTATSFKVTSSTRIDLRTATGTCEAWYVRNGKLYQAARTSGSIPSHPSYAKVKLEQASQVNSSTPYFLYKDAGLQYSISSGSGVGHVDLIGQATPRATGGDSSPCWS